MGKIYVFDGKGMHKVSSGALAMAIDIDQTISALPTYTKTPTEGVSVTQLLEDLEEKKEQLKRSEKLVAEYDRVFKKYDKMFGILVSVIKTNLSPSVVQAVGRTLAAIWGRVEGGNGQDQQDRVV